MAATASDVNNIMKKQNTSVTFPSSYLMAFLKFRRTAQASPVTVLRDMESMCKIPSKSQNTTGHDVSSQRFI
jgi:hypothetical protein